MFFVQPRLQIRQPCFKNIKHIFSKINLATENFKNKTQKFPIDFLERKTRLQKVNVAIFFFKTQIGARSEPEKAAVQ